MVEVWHANGEGLYENQEPDRQPEFNLRGKFVADAADGFGSAASSRMATGCRKMARSGNCSTR